jgi:hypothetical protein
MNVAIQPCADLTAKDTTPIRSPRARIAELGQGQAFAVPKDHKSHGRFAESRTSLGSELMGFEGPECRLLTDYRIWSKPYLREEMLGCSQEKRKSAILGNILVINPINGAKPNPTNLNQNSAPN